MATDKHRPTRERRKGQRRSGKDRRKKLVAIPFPDSRLGKERRSGKDRRKRAEDVEE